MEHAHGADDCRHWCTSSPVHDAYRRVFAQVLASPPSQGKWVPVDEGTAAALAAEVESGYQKYPQVCVKRFTCKADKYAEKYESDALKPFDAQAFAQSVKGKTVTFLGDSVMREFMFDLSCTMAQSGLMAKDWFGNSLVAGNASMKPAKWGEPDPFAMTLTNGAKLQYHLIGVPQGDGYWGPKVNQSGFLDADIIVLNMGAHYPQFSWLKKPLDIIDALIQEQIRPNGRRLWLEYSPTHFHSSERFGGKTDTDSDIDSESMLQTSIGDGPAGQDGDCGEVALTRQGQVQAKATQFRLEDANRLMEEKGWEILRTHDIAVSQWYMHKGGQDCRHWCTNSPVHDAHRRVLAKALSA